MIHVRWSGEGMWIPMGDTRWEGLTYENHTSYPSKGEMLIYPGGISEMEMILAYGSVCFAIHCLFLCHLSFLLTK